jgi:outer membrane protein insertion porin family/translocation and assembly module TamA
MRPLLPSPALALLIVGWALTGCASIPEGRSAIDSVDVVGSGALEAGDVEERLATAASPKLLGLFRGIFYDYEVFDASILQRDLARVERYYRGHGFLEAHARAGEVIRVSNNHVRVRIVVDEGPPTLVAELPPAIVAAAQGAAGTSLPTGARFDEEAYAKARTAVTRAFTDHGYAYAKVQSDAQVDLATHSVDYVFTAEPGIVAVLGPITLVDTQEAHAHDGASKFAAPFEEKALRRALNLVPGTTYSTADIDAATQALLDLEVLSSVQIVPTLSDPPSPVVPLTVRVEPSKLHEVRLGGGFEFDEIKTELHGLVSWEHHDFLGDLRDFRADLKPGVVLYPMRVNNIVKPTNPLPEERLRLQFRQPSFLEARTTLLAQPEGNVFPMLVAPNPEISQPVLGYGELKGAVGLERRFGNHVLLRVSQNVQSEFPFAYTSIPLQRPTPAVVLSYPQLVSILDLRDDPIRTHSGFYASNDLTVAGVGGSASDVRIQPEVRGYVPIGRHITFATRATLGVLLSSNYGDYVQHHLYPPLNPNGASSNRLYSAVDRDIEIVYFRGFFSGGPGSNRGYPLRGIAPHGVVPFLSPVTLQAQQQSSQQGFSCIPTQSNYDASKCAIPIGGFTLWEASAEVRFDVSGPLGLALFCDMGDVAPGELQVRLNYLHLSCGTGARYDTPVGAIRLDLAYRLVDVVGKESEADKNIDGTPPTFLGVPIALAFGIGETF